MVGQMLMCEALRTWKKFQDKTRGQQSNVYGRFSERLDLLMSIVSLTEEMEGKKETHEEELSLLREGN